jgi:hypothetical protein
MKRFLLGFAAALAVAAAPVSAQEAVGGRMVPDTLHSKALEKNLYGDTPERPMLVYLPESYATSPSKRYPVVYLLHRWVCGTAATFMARSTR